LTKKLGISPSFKIWLGKDHDYVLGEGGATLLRAIDHYGSISEAARQTGVSYRFAWGQLADIEKGLGHPILERRKGGVAGGGAKLTEAAMTLLRNYDRTKSYVGSVLKNSQNWQAIRLQMSARNRIKGTIDSIQKDAHASIVKIKIQAPVTITAVITKEAVDELKIKPRDEVEAIIKSTQVMLAKE
jgi:molybdate transport system regulatory protein